MPVRQMDSSPTPIAVTTGKTAATMCVAGSVCPNGYQVMNRTAPFHRGTSRNGIWGQSNPRRRCNSDLKTISFASNALQRFGTGQTAREGQQQSGKLDGAIDDLATNFDSLPEETKAHLRTAMERLPMPQSWAAERAEMWGKLDRSAQDYIAQRELEAQRKISELGNRNGVAAFD